MENSMKLSILTDSYSGIELEKFLSEIIDKDSNNVSLYYNQPLASYQRHIREAHVFINTFPFIASTTTSTDYINNGVLVGCCPSFKNELRGINRVLQESGLRLLRSSLESLPSLLKDFSKVQEFAHDNLMRLKKWAVLTSGNFSDLNDMQKVISALYANKTKLRESKAYM